MQFTVDRLRVEITTKDCQIPEDERARLQAPLAAQAEAVKDFANPSLRGKVIYHPKSAMYHVEFRLELPARSLFASEEDPYLDTALQRALAGLTREAEAYRDRPDSGTAATERRAALDEDVIAPQDPTAGPLGEAATSGDYRAFRIALADYEEWLRKRVGRIVQRIPEAQARVVRKELLLGDVVEDVYLSAFAGYTARPTAVRLSEWLEGLIEPSIRALLRHPDEESQAASLARTLREVPL